MTEDWRNINMANWESRVPLHTAPDGYDLAAFDDPDICRRWCATTCPARAARRPRRRAPAVPHRLRHGVADPTRRSFGDRLDFSPPHWRRANLAAGPTPTCASSKPTPRRGRGLGRMLRRGLHRYRRDLLAARHPPLGPRDRRPAASRWPTRSCGRDTRSCGRSAIRGRTGCWCIEYPYFDTGGTTFVEDDTYAGSGVVTRARVRHLQPRDSGRSSPRSPTPGWRSPPWWSIGRCRGIRWAMP